MTNNRKTTKAVYAVAAGALIASTGITAQAAPLAGVSGLTSINTNTQKESSYSTLSGVSKNLADILATAANSDATVSTNETETTAAPAADQAAEAQQPAEEVNEYANVGIAQAGGSYINVRSSADANADIVGYLYDNNAVTITDASVDGWYGVTSGNINGFVASQFIVAGDQATCEAAQTKTVTVNADVPTLKVRSAADANASVITMVAGSTSYEVTDTATEGWYGINTADGAGYVSAEYSTLNVSYTYGETVDEANARIAAEEAARKAEEEAAAAKKAAEEAEAAKAAQKAAAKSASTTTSSTASTSSSQTTSAPASGSGSSVVSYASQFVGNPYVYGGTSLTNGADCSGFVMSVYSHFGVSLPHSSSADRGVGVGVSVSDMQPGDIVCYSGHVGIYAGGGMIVNASNPTRGICYTPVGYKPIVAVRRVL